LISLKYQFWILKTVNKTAEASGTLRSNYISEHELNQSLIHLEDEILNEKIREKNFIFILKAAYELGFYYYLKNDLIKMKTFFDFCIGKKSLLKESDLRLLYFTLNDLEDLLELIFTNGELNLEKNCSLKTLFTEENYKINDKNILLENRNNDDVEMIDNSIVKEDTEKIKLDGHITKMDIDNYKNIKEDNDRNDNNHNYQCCNLNDIYFLAETRNKEYNFNYINFSEEEKINQEFRNEIAVFFQKNTLYDDSQKALIEVFIIIIIIIITNLNSYFIRILIK
jgi:hypothetical protein